MLKINNVNNYNTWAGKKHKQEDSGSKVFISIKWNKAKQKGRQQGSKKYKNKPKPGSQAEQNRDQSYQQVQGKAQIEG